jgi:type IV pilus assembly protein PilY1
VIPQVLIVLSKHIQMFGQAYPGILDMDGDGRADTGFNPGVEYVGYFDSRSCYRYLGATYKGLYGEYATGEPNGYFLRAGAATEDDSQAQVNAGRPRGLPEYVISPRSATGICRNVKYGNAGTFSGNWLNYVATSRMDAIRRILYGGARNIDNTNDTYLEGSFVPPDSTVWGAEIRSDDTWAEVTPLSAYFDVTKYTPYAKPKSKKAHFFGRGSDLAEATRFPALRVLLDADRSSIDIGGTDGVGQKVVATMPYGRYWDWVLVNRPLPDDRVLRPAVRSTVLVYRIRLRACVSGNTGAGEGCLRYPGATDSPSDDVWKPAGLLQKYGEGPGAMEFGLMTGGFGPSIRTEGAKLRNHVGPVTGIPPFPAGAYVPAVNARTGQFLGGGLLRNLDLLRIAGRDNSIDPRTWEGARYYNEFSWGNPMGEMVYEAVRYMAGAPSPTPGFTSERDSDTPGSPILSLTSFDAAQSWTLGRPTTAGATCPRPVILLISDITTDWDGNAVGTDLNLSPVWSSLGGGLTPSDMPASFDMGKYLDTITRLEGIDRSGSVKYYHSTGTSDSCSPKALTRGLAGVKGVCPNAQSSMGTYSAAAVAYYAHTHDVNRADVTGLSASGIDIYAVTMSPPFPELVFAVKDSAGREQKRIAVLPVNISSIVSGYPEMGFLNYFILDMDTDRKGTVFSSSIKVNFSDSQMGGDWEGDGQVTFTVDLLTDASTPTSMRTTAKVPVDSGDTPVRGGTFYKFRNPATATSARDFIDIQPQQVKALLIRSEWEERGTANGMAMGYSISGSVRDGTYLDLTMNRPPASSKLTPKGCPYADGPATGAEGCGARIVDLKSQSRIFQFAASSDYRFLPNPLYLAAKYGGFGDGDSNGVPGPGEWEGEDGETPRNYFQAVNIAQLPGMLESAFRNIAKSMSTGTASSASLDSVLGGGISVQTYFYPELTCLRDPAQRVRWTGSVFGLFLDRWGNLREDTDGDGQLTVKNQKDGARGDYVVTFSSVKTPPMNPPACYASGHFISLCFDPWGTNTVTPVQGSMGRPESIFKVKALFDSGRWLSRLSDARLLSGPRPWSAPATAADGRRRIYWGHPAPDPRAPGGYTVRRNIFEPSDLNGMKLLASLMLHSNFRQINPGLGQDRAAAAKKLTEWLIGVDSEGLRSRQMGDPWTDDATPVTMRMGDVLNSKPILSGPPASGFDLLYGDRTYRNFRSDRSTRRLMAYFGANDGMLHAVNVGFAGGLVEGAVSYRLSTGSQTPHELGAEIWAYVPTSLLPHLQFLADPDYRHAYYADLKPLVVDAKIDGEWRTVLIAGLRLGGRPVPAPDPSVLGAEHFFSEVFALDVTDPEREPALLWRYSSLQAGLTVGMPTVVSSGGRWYAVLPSGPVTDQPVGGSGAAPPRVDLGATSPYAGESTQNARLIVLDMDTGREISAGSAPGYLTVQEPASFFNNPFMPMAARRATPWTNHAVYFGLTVSRDRAAGRDSGAVYRLQTVDHNGEALPPEGWSLKRLYATDRPVTGAVNSTYDTKGNLWVVFGTGRLWSMSDVQPCTGHGTADCMENHSQFLYGIKEELNQSGNLTFRDRTLDAPFIVNVTGVKVFRTGAVTDIPTQSSGADPGSITSYRQLAALIASPASIGYKRQLDMGSVFRPGEPHAFEMVLTQPKFVTAAPGKSLAAFTSFEPKPKECGASGFGYLYLVDTFTGLPEPTVHDAFHASASAPSPDVSPGQVVGALDVGEGNPSEAFVTVTASGITVSAAAPDASIHSFTVNRETGGSGSGIISWREVQDTGFKLSPNTMVRDLGDGPGGQRRWRIPGGR